MSRCADCIVVHYTGNLWSDGITLLKITDGKFPRYKGYLATLFHGQAYSNIWNCYEAIDALVHALIQKILEIYRLLKYELPSLPLTRCSENSKHVIKSDIHVIIS